MRVMVFVKATEESEAGAPPAPGMMEAIGRFNAQLHQAGILLLAEGLRPSSAAKRVGFDGDGRTVIHGPFAETRALVAGFWLWEVHDMAEAVAWVKRCRTRWRGEARSRSGRCLRWPTSRRPCRRRSRPFRTGSSGGRR